MKHFIFLTIILAVFLSCACPAPKEDYVIANTSGDTLNVQYKVMNCSANPDWTDWIPKMHSYENYLEGSDWITGLLENEYSLDIKSEQIRISDQSEDTVACKIANYNISIPKDKALRISNGDFQTLGQIQYLKLDGAKGIVVFDKNQSLLKDYFKLYRRNFLKRSQNTISY